MKTQLSENRCFSVDGSKNYFLICFLINWQVEWCEKWITKPFKIPIFQLQKRKRTNQNPNRQRIKAHSDKKLPRHLSMHNHSVAPSGVRIRQVERVRNKLHCLSKRCFFSCCFFFFCCSLFPLLPNETVVFFLSFQPVSFVVRRVRSLQKIRFNEEKKTSSERFLCRKFKK